MTTIPAGTRARRAGTARGRRLRLAALFLAPFMALYSIFTIAPLVYALVMSLFTERASGLGFGGGETVFVGVGNYVRGLTDAAFLQSFGNVALYCIVYIPVMTMLALVIALLLDSAVAKARSFFRLAFYLPNIVPALIASIIWLYLYTPGISPLVAALEGVGVRWDLTSTAGALFSLANLAVWLHTGYNVVLFYSALQAVPREVIEAAAIDGAGPLHVAFSIKARMISGAIGVAILFTVVGAMQLFAEPLLLSQRAPAINSTWTPNMFIYRTAFEKHDMGYAAATAVLFAVVIGLLSWVVTRISQRGDS